MGTGGGEPCVGGVAVMGDEGGTVVGDIENLKHRTFWKFRIFGFFFVGGIFSEI